MNSAHNSTTSIEKILAYFHLNREEEDYQVIHETISQGIIFRGTNLWILMFAIVVASVGLNMNSTAVIIGAMLISPLMGPINGVGYSVATYNFPLFRSSLKNFGFAVGASLAASTIYFALSPVSVAHSELLARTSPTIYDVIIALFGGCAGILAISSKLKGNVIPGVAIATALMPPLCTAGYGLATGQFTFFFGALYLFTINTVFIALSSFMVSQFLKFPFVTIVDAAKKTKVNRILYLVIALTAIPSIYFGYQLVKKEKFKENASRYINNVASVDGNYLLKSDVDPDKRAITLVYGGNSLLDADKKSIREKAADFSLSDCEVDIRQGFSFQNQNDEAQNYMAESDKYKLEIGRLKYEINKMVKEQDSLTARLHIGGQLLAEAKAIYPTLVACAFAESYRFEDASKQGQKIPVVIVTTQNEPLSAEDQIKLEAWLQARIKNTAIRTYFEVAGAAAAKQ